MPPINEILASSYARIKYWVLSVAEEHTLTMYFDSVPVADGLGWKFTAYTDGAHATGWLLNEIIREHFDRMSNTNPVCPLYAINSVEVWSTQPGANVFMGFDTSDYTAFVSGTSTPVAAAYFNAVFQTADRSQMRWYFFDNGDSAPQHTPQSQPPTVDNTSFAWWVINGPIGFTNNDGKAITRIVSYNTGYNRKLARLYGKTKAP